MKPLFTYLIRPVVRRKEYRRFLFQLLQCTPKNHPDYQKVQDAMGWAKNLFLSPI